MRFVSTGRKPDNTYSFTSYRFVIIVGKNQVFKLLLIVNV